MTKISDFNHIDHNQPYSDDYLQAVLKSVKTIAMVGASQKSSRASFGVLAYLSAAGYDMIPVNPSPAITEIQGLKVYNSLADIDRPIDMVDVFRRSEFLMGVAQEAAAIGAKVLWSQLGVFDAEAASFAENAGMKVVMNRCPKIELTKAF